jgi:hypothetical protein
MKKITTALLAGIAGVLTLASTPAFAADDVQTITGDCKCAKCALHETDKCQNAIQTTKDGKTVTYYLTDNAVSKEFHENVCKSTEKVTATGKVSEKDGKMMLTVSKIEAAK